MPYGLSIDGTTGEVIVGRLEPHPSEIQQALTGKIKAKLDTKDFSGPISKSILVMTDDPQDPTVTLVIKADVRPFVEILPRPLIRFNAVSHEPMSQTFIVAGADPEQSLKVNKIESSVPFIATSIRKLGEEEKLAGKSKDQYEVTMTLTDETPVGPVNAVLTVNTDVKEAPKVPVKVYGVVRALIHVTPTQVQFGSVDDQFWNVGKRILLPGPFQLQLVETAR